MRRIAYVLGLVAVLLAPVLLAGPADAAAYGNVRNGGSSGVWVNSTMVPPGYTSRQVGVADANYISIPEGHHLALWQIASSGGKTYWAWKGCYPFSGTLALGNTSYYAELDGC